MIGIKKKYKKNSYNQTTHATTTFRTLNEYVYPSPVTMLCPRSHFAALFSWLFLRTARLGAQSVLYAALDMNLDYVTGQYIE